MKYIPTFKFQVGNTRTEESRTHIAKLLKAYRARPDNFAVTVEKAGMYRVELRDTDVPFAIINCRNY